MITIFYEKYYNDFKREHFTKEFNNLEELANWIFNQMKTNYSDKERGWLCLNFPSSPERISFKPQTHGPKFWIHQINNENGILFSDGVHTTMQKHMGNEVKNWCLECEHRQYNSKFNFI